MFDEGAVDGVDYVIAQHIDPTSPVGTIAMTEGPSGGGVETWYATIIGKGGHGAYPHTTIDPFVLLSHVIIAINGIVSRRIDPFQPSAISIGVINGGFAENVIPDKVTMKGTIRFTSLNVQKQIREELKSAFEIVKALGGNYELEVVFGGMPLINDKYVSEVIRQVGIDLLGEGNVQEMHKSLGAEDFPEFLKNAPGAMFTLGTKIEGREVYELHHPKFDLDERALPVGTAVLAETALRFLNS